MDEVLSRSRAGELRDWPQVNVSLRAFTYGQVGDLVSDVLDHAGEPDLISSVLTVSGRNLRLAVRMPVRIVLRGGLWTMTGPDLMDLEHFAGTIEAVLNLLSKKEGQALSLLSLRG